MTAMTPHRRTLWIMLTCLGLGFTVSQGYRSVAALMAPALPMARVPTGIPAGI